jgi:hypothetical protein
MANLNPAVIKAFFGGFYSDKGQEQFDSLTNSAKRGKAVQSNVLMTKVTYTYPASGLAVDDYIGLTQIPAGADILWNDITVQADSDCLAEGAGEVGFLQNSDGAFVKAATLVKTELKLSTIIPVTDAVPVDEVQWLAFKAKGTLPTAGKITFQIPYLATN